MPTFIYYFPSCFPFLCNAPRRVLFLPKVSIVPNAHSDWKSITVAGCCNKTPQTDQIRKQPCKSKFFFAEELRAIYVASYDAADSSSSDGGWKIHRIRKKIDLSPSRGIEKLLNISKLFTAGGVSSQRSPEEALAPGKTIVNGENEKNEGKSINLPSRRLGLRYKMRCCINVR